MVVLSVWLFPLRMNPSSLWQWVMASFLGNNRALRKARILFLFLMTFHSMVSSPLSSYIYPCICTVAKVYQLSV